MKNKILKSLLTTITYCVLGATFGYRDNLQDVLMPTFMVLFALINVFMIDKNKKPLVVMLTVSMPSRLFRR